jgi:hypothetical protein
MEDPREARRYVWRSTFASNRHSHLFIAHHFDIVFLGLVSHAHIQPLKAPSPIPTSQDLYLVYYSGL